jgi:hypothetical protein
MGSEEFPCFSPLHAVAAALIFGAASAVQAASENDGGNETGGFHYGPMGQYFGGANPVYHRSLRYGTGADMAPAPLPSFPAIAGTGDGIRRAHFARRRISPEQPEERPQSQPLLFAAPDRDIVATGNSSRRFKNRN